MGNLWYTRPVKRYLIHSIPGLFFSSGLFRSPLSVSFLPLELRLQGVPQTLVIEQTLNLSNCADSDVLVPDVSVSKVHDVLVGDGIDLALDLARAGTAASGDQLATDVLGEGSGAVQGQQDGGLQLGLGALNLGFADVGAQANPLAESKVNKVVEARSVVSDQVDTPETIDRYSQYISKYYARSIIVPTYPVSL